MANSVGTDFLNQLNNSLAPQRNLINQQADQSTALLRQQMGMLQANQQTQNRYALQDQAFGKQRWDLSNEGLGIQQGQIGRASALLPQSHALTTQGLADQLAQAKYGAGMQRRTLGSQATVAGSTVSTGARQGFKDIAKNLGFSKRDIARARKAENLNYAEKQASLADQQKQLNLAARGLGIDAQELNSRTQRALEQTGLSTSVSVMDITRAINDVAAGRYNALQGLIAPLYQAGGIRPTAGG